MLTRIFVAFAAVLVLAAPKTALAADDAIAGAIVGAITGAAKRLWHSHF